MDEVVIEYQLTWREWRTIYWGASARKNAWAFVVFFAFFFGLSALVFADHSGTWAIVIAILALGYIVSSSWITPRRYWNSAVGVQEAKRVAVSDEGVVRRSESLEERLDWGRFRRLNVTKDYFILVGRPGTGSLYIPKRGLATAHDEATLLELILRHLPA